jgi:hypothetical protein
MLQDPVLVARRSVAVALAFAIATVAASRAAAQVDEMAIITVHNRPAEDLVEVLRPLVEPRGSVAFMNDRLIIRTLPGAMASIRKMVAELDVAPRSLMLTIRRQGHRTDTQESIEGSGMVSAGDTNAITTRSGVRGTVTNESRASRVVVGGAFGSSTVDTTSGALQQVQALEGRKAFIGTGVETPQFVTAAPWPVTVAGQSALSGFHALSRVSGDLVRVEIWISDDHMAPSGRVRTDRLTTTLSGRIGEWLSLGGIERSSSTTSREPLARDTGTSSQLSALELRVELLR